VGDGGNQEGAKEIAGNVLGKADAHILAETGHSRAVRGVRVGATAMAELPRMVMMLKGSTTLRMASQPFSLGVRA